MTGRVYYNDFDAGACDYLENLIAERLIPAGVVDRRSILDVQPGDLDGFSHCHFFAGVGGWALAALLAGWPEERPLWTGSCPCQPFSLAGEKLGADDERHLWPDLFRLIDARRPPVVVGEQVAGALGYGWLDGVRADLGGGGYASRAVDIPAAAVDSPQIRQRLYWVARRSDALARADRAGREPLVDASGLGRGEGRPEHELWSRGDAAADANEQGRRGGAVASGAGELGGEQQPLGGPERRTAPAGDDAGEPRTRALAGPDSGREQRWGLRRSSEGRGENGERPHDQSGGPDGVGARALHMEGAERGGREGRNAAHSGGAEHGAANPSDGGYQRNGSWWADHSWIICHDEKARRIPDPSIPLLVTGVSGGLAVLRSGQVVAPEEVAQAQEVRWVNRVAAWKGFGNAINPVLAAEVLGALLDGED